MLRARVKYYSFHKAHFGLVFDSNERQALVQLIQQNEALFIAAFPWQSWHWRHAAKQWTDDIIPVNDEEVLKQIWLFRINDFRHTIDPSLCNVELAAKNFAEIV